MPVVDAAIIAACRAEIDADFGPIPSGLLPSEQAIVNAQRDKLAKVVARSGQYCRDNNQVNPGQDVASVSFTNPAGAVTGHGITDSPGTWS